METNQVDTAVKPFEQAQEFVGMLGRVIHATPTDIFKTYTALVRPVVLLEQCYHIAEVIHLFNRHNLLTFSGKRIVQRDCQMAVALFDEALK